MKKQASIFSLKVWELASLIPRGRVTTYGIIARIAGGGGQAARSISSILDKSPNKVPWHRIVYSDGRVWTSNENKRERMRLYKKERIKIDENGKIENFKDILYDFSNLIKQ